MDNFFNYISKPMSQDDVDIWFRVNNMIPEKLELFSDFSLSLNQLMFETYFGDDSDYNETKIIMSNEDKRNHFNWCWNKSIENFLKENIEFQRSGEHYDYFWNFFDDIFYNQKEQKVRESIPIFFNELFDVKKSFTKSDLDMITTIYKLLDKNMKKVV